MSAEQEWQLLSDEEKTKLTVDGKDGEGVGFHGYTKRKHVTKVVFLPNITKVGNFACINAKILVTVDIPEGVESIGDYAFSGCSELKTATIPKSLRNFGKHIFWECTSLVPSDIDVSQEYRDATSTVVTYLRFKQSVSSKHLSQKASLFNLLLTLCLSRPSEFFTRVTFQR